MGERNEERKIKGKKSWREMRVNDHMVVKGVNLSKLCVFILLFWVLTEKKKKKLDL